MSNPGSGGVASFTAANVDRRERLRQLTLEALDVRNDPYFLKNHLGSYECKLCFTLHKNEGSYLIHTQGRRHQQNLAIRNARMAKEKKKDGAKAGESEFEKKKRDALARKMRVPRVGRPGYNVVKQKDPVSGAHSLLFRVHYPEIQEGFQPRHRFMSSFEQRVEPKDPRYQYLVFAAEPYETVAFKIPNAEIDNSEGKFFTDWDRESKVFTLQLFFKGDVNELLKQQQQGNDGNNQASSSSSSSNQASSGRVMVPSAAPAQISFGKRQARTY